MDNLYLQNHKESISMGTTTNQPTNQPSNCAGIIGAGLLLLHLHSGYDEYNTPHIVVYHNGLLCMQALGLSTL